MVLRSLRSYDHIIPFAFAHQDMLSEQQIICGYRASRIWFPDIVQVDSATFDIFTRLAFGRTKTGMHQQLDQRLSIPLELVPGDFFGGHLTHYFVESHFGNACKFATKKTLACARCLRGRTRAVD